MDKLKLQVAKVRRRLTLQAFLASTVWFCFVTLLCAIPAIAVQKLWLVGVDGQLWATYWLGGAVAAGLLGAGLSALVQCRRDLDAAIELDRRFGLKERVSSCLALTPDELNSPSGQALAADATARVAEINVAGRFPVKFSRRVWLLMAPASLALAICFFLDPIGGNQVADNTATSALQFQTAAASLGSKLAEKRNEAEKKGLKEAEQLIKKVEEETKTLAKSEPHDRTESLAKLNDLAAELDQRRQQLAAGQKLQQQLAQMKHVPPGPADKLAQNMKDARFDDALGDLATLSQQIAAGQLDPQKLDALARQLATMQEALEKTAGAQQAMSRDLKQQVANARSAGDRREAQRIEDQLSPLQLQSPAMDRLANLAKSLGECAAAMNGGKAGQGQGALNSLASALAQLQRDTAEMQLLDDAHDQIADAKAASTCQQCGGAGCAACQDHNGADGIGSSPGGQGTRPEDPKDANFYDAKVRSSPGSIGPTVPGLVDAPNSRGTVLENIKVQVNAARHESSEPSTVQRLPKAERDQARQYFDALRQDR